MSVKTAKTAIVCTQISTGVYEANLKLKTAVSSFERNRQTSGKCNSVKPNCRRQSAIGNRQSAIGNRQSAIGNRQSAIGNRQSAIGNR
ncbi:MAG: hypothetical protein LBC52_05050, partial [Treponema sp.]|nr:hypothetical protein [Treponema sp.]